MSIYNTRYPNELDIRTRSTKTDSLLVWNPVSEQYERISPGGGGEPVALPYYLRANDVLFDGATAPVNAELVNNVLDIRDNVLPAHEVSLEQIDTGLQNVNNVILPAHEASLNELDGRVAGNTSNLSTLTTRVGGVEAVNTTQNTNITALQTKTAPITVNVSSLNFAQPGGNYKAHIDVNGLKVYSGASTTAAGYPHTKIDGSSITFVPNSGSGGVYLDTSRVDNIAKLISVTNPTFNTALEITKPLTLSGVTTSLADGKKMVVIDPTTKLVTFADIPGTGVTDPITFTSGGKTTTVGSSFVSTQNVVGGVTNSVTMSNGSLEFARSTASETTAFIVDLDFLGSIPMRSVRRKELNGNSVNSTDLLKWDPSSNDLYQDTTLPFNATMSDGDIVVLNCYELEKDTWYGFTVNGGDQTKIPVYRFSYSSKNSTDPLVVKGNPIVSQNKTVTINGVAKAVIFFKILETYIATGMSYTPTTVNITFELISRDESTISAY